MGSTVGHGSQGLGEGEGSSEGRAEQQGDGSSCEAEGPLLQPVGILHITAGARRRAIPVFPCLI